MLSGEIRPIIKDPLGDKNSSDNYRPIMNSSNFLKLFEYCLNVTYQKKIRLNSRQFSYRKHTSCNLANAVLREVIGKYNSHNSDVHCAFLDMSKAFDKVNHYKLFMQLLDSDVPNILVKLIISMYENQNVSVMFNDISSDTWKIGNGIRQGGVLSGILFNLYINDVINAICEMIPGCSLDLYKINIIGYADDLTLMAPSAKGLQLILDKLVTMINSLNLKMNERKSVYMIFRSQKSKFNDNPKIFMNNTDLKIVSEHKYLGTIITSDKSNKIDIQKESSSFLKQFYGMYRKFYYADKKILRNLFQSYCTSFYGCELWYDIKGAKNEFHNLSISYHKAIKTLYNLPPWHNNHDLRILSDMTGLPIFKHLINKRTQI
jgi:hypothetical protein